jgi:hypothetical protein
MSKICLTEEQEWELFHGEYFKTRLIFTFRGTILVFSHTA